MTDPALQPFVTRFFTRSPWEGLVRDLTNKRRELIAQLKAIQNDQPLIEDSIRVSQAARRVGVLRELLANMRSSGRRLESESPQGAGANASPAEMAAWNGQVRAAIYARKPSGVPGSATVSFVVSAGGRVSSASASGDSEMRPAALSAVRGASVPPAPDHRAHAFTIRIHD